MRRLQTRTLGARRLWGLSAVAAVLALLLVGTSAHAITVFFDGQDGWGVGPAFASEAQAEGIPVVTPSGNPPVELMSLSSDEGGDEVAPFSIEVSSPVPLENVSIPGSPSRDTPVEAADDWTLTNSGGSREQFWMVFLGKSSRQDLPGDGYDPTEVGLELDPSLPWGLIQVGGSDPGADDVFYPSFFIGDLAAESGTAQIPVRYRVGRSLLDNSEGTPLLPRFTVGQTTAPIPEPTTFALLGAGLIGLAAAGRRH